MAKFRLQPVLKLRKHREEGRKRELAEALAAESTLKDGALRLARLRQEQADEFRRQQQQEGVLDVRAIIERRFFIGQVERRLAGELTQVALAERETASRRGRLVAAVKERRALDVLQERHQARERQAEFRREADELDEVAARVYSMNRAAGE